MLFVFIKFFLGFFLLIKGGDFLVDGASNLAKRLRVSDLVVGLTIVAFGSSAPEFIVSITSSINDFSGLAFGNIIGSNISNTALILGLASLFYPLSAKSSTIYREIPFSILSVIVVMVMANDHYLNNETSSIISLSEGLILLLFFLIFIYYIFFMAKSENKEESKNISSTFSIWRFLFFILLGILGLMLGGNWIVEGGVSIATFFGMSQTVIGLTIVAVGTSLPELATTVIASYKKKSDIAIGNIIGSNIFNIFWVLGFSAIITPLPIDAIQNIDIIVSALLLILLYLFFFIGKKKVLERSQGIVLLSCYFFYIVYLIKYRFN